MIGSIYWNRIFLNFKLDSDEVFDYNTNIVATARDSKSTHLDPNHTHFILGIWKITWFILI